jgi:hypothetical protein
MWLNSALGMRFFVAGQFYLAQNNSPWVWLALLICIPLGQAEPLDPASFLLSSGSHRIFVVRMRARRDGF